MSNGIWGRLYWTPNCFEASIANFCNVRYMEWGPTPCTEKLVVFLNFLFARLQKFVHYYIPIRRHHLNRRLVNCQRQFPVDMGCLMLINLLKSTQLPFYILMWSGALFNSVNLWWCHMKNTARPQRTLLEERLIVLIFLTSFPLSSFRKQLGLHPPSCRHVCVTEQLYGHKPC